MDDSPGDRMGPPQSSKTRVLIADDDDALRETIKIWLSDEGWEVLEAVNGQEVLEKLDDSIIVLLLDRHMPQISGPEVIEQLDKTAFHGTVVVMSAYEPDTHLNENDVDKYITKPIEHDQFVSELRQSVQ